MSTLFTKLKTPLLVLMLISVVTGSWVFIQNVTETNTASAQKHQNQPDGFAKKISYTSTDERGDVKSQLKSVDITHYPLNNRATLTKPAFTLYNNNDTPWVIKADRAEAIHGNTIIHLSGNVTIDKKASKTKSDMHLRSNKLTFYPKEDRLETDQPVTLIKPSMTIHAVGLKADLKKENVTLLSKTRITYTPKSKK